MFGSDEIPATTRVPFLPIDRLPGPGERAALVDLRASIEFADDHIPGAIHVPLFEDQARSFVGLLYRQFSPEAAFQEGRAAVAERIDGLVQEVARAIGWQVPAQDLTRRVLAMTEGGIARMERELTPEPLDRAPPGAVVFACARGGLRSRSVVALMRSLGLDAAVGLEGGYRSYRKRVMAALDAWESPLHVVSLRGLTGVGKTLVLRAVERLRPGWTLDLEAIAGHRSSLLGMVGLEPVSQKAFESGLVARAERGFADGVLVVEGESRKVGDVVVPVRFWDAMLGATNVELIAPTARRVEVLAEDYLADRASLPKLREQLDAVANRMAAAGSRDAAPDLAGMLDRGEVGALVELLLDRYYDPLYRRSETGKAYAVTVDASDVEGAAEAIVEWIETSLVPVDRPG